MIKNKYRNNLKIRFVYFDTVGDFNGGLLSPINPIAVKITP